MARTVTVPSQTYAPGTYGPVALRSLPGNAEGFQITFTRTAWPVGHCLTVVTEWSHDNGVTWDEMRRTTFDGGDHYDWRGNLVTTCGLAQTWPWEAGPSGRVTRHGTDVRITATVAQTLTTSITVEAL